MDGGHAWTNHPTRRNRRNRGIGPCRGISGLANTSAKSSSLSAILDSMPSKNSPPALSFIADEQAQAIAHVSGPMLVIAGAGTGKTTVLTKRIAALISEGHARPDEILALTYTDNAA